MGPNADWFVDGGDTSGVYEESVCTLGSGNDAYSSDESSEFFESGLALDGFNFKEVVLKCRN